ncbi:GntR family transcriptional regulator [Streptomyces sp. NPDC012888]|uniref:GntR family transcriptional regulator n=1 Tax=Streptomyces sp. NPDC012888 TaxID=3364855 RepID=UPI0036CCBF92
MTDNRWTSTSTPYLVPRAAGDTDAWTAEAAALGRKGGQRVLHAGEEPASREVAALLGLVAGEPVVARRRLIELDGEPHELTDSYYPYDIAAGTPLAGTARIRGGAVSVLASLGHAGVRATEHVTARMPDPGERDRLRTGEGEPVLRVARVTYDAAGRPVQADVMLMPAARQQLRYEIGIG